MFKKCSNCSLAWATRESFLKATTYVCDFCEVGLAMRNCMCGTTIGIESELLYPDKDWNTFWKSDPKYWLVIKLRKDKPLCA